MSPKCLRSFVCMFSKKYKSVGCSCSKKYTLKSGRTHSNQSGKWHDNYGLLVDKLNANNYKHVWFVYVNLYYQSLLFMSSIWEVLLRSEIIKCVFN